VVCNRNFESSSSSERRGLCSSYKDFRSINNIQNGFSTADLCGKPVQ
jgi:hypothetical protein